MDEIGGMSQLLKDMKMLRSQAIRDQVIPIEMGIGAEKPVQNRDFSDLLKTAIDKVNDVQKESGRMKRAFEVGDPRVDITQVMIASQKSSIAFEAMKQVRNKVIEAYKEVMNMPV